jgi:hypothetical protein
MTLYIAVDGTNPEALDAADDELIADTVHQLLCDEVLVQDIETVGVVEGLEDEIDGAVIDEKSLRVLAEEAKVEYEVEMVDPDLRDVISHAKDNAYDALQNND